MSDRSARSSDGRAVGFQSQSVAGSTPAAPSLRHRLWHWLAQRCGWNQGQLVSFRDESDQIWIGFKCLRCSQVFGLHYAPVAGWLDPRSIEGPFTRIAPLDYSKITIHGDDFFFDSPQMGWEFYYTTAKEQAKMT